MKKHMVVTTLKGVLSQINIIFETKKNKVYLNTK